MKKCEYCNKQITGEYTTGRFCNKKCASGFSTKKKRNEINKKISKALRGRTDHIWNKKEKKILICPHCGKTRKVHQCNNVITCGGTSCVGKQLSKSLKGKTGGYRIGAGRSKGDYYKNQYFDSMYEIEVAKFLDENDIKWKRNTKRFYYIFNNKKTYYIPDFFIENKLYLETKGYWYGNKKERTYEAVKQNKLNWILLLQKKEWWKDKNILLNKIRRSIQIG